MKKSMTLLATSLFALYGCGGGGGSSSGSTDGNKGPSNQVDYPIASSAFAPKPETTLGYSFTKDGQTEGVMTMNFTPLSGELIIAGLEEETGNEAEVQVINDLINYGITEFYVSEDIMTNIEGTEKTAAFILQALTVVYTKSPMPTLLVANTSQPLCTAALFSV